MNKIEDIFDSKFLYCKESIPANTFMSGNGNDEFTKGVIYKCSNIQLNNYSKLFFITNDYGYQVSISNVSKKRMKLLTKHFITINEHRKFIINDLINE